MINYFSQVLKIPLTVLFILATLTEPWTSWARPIQILHTNDLHSHLEYGDSRGTGGYEAVHRVIERLKARAAEQNIEALVLDAGDFSEGSPFFFADEGRASWKAIDSMGYDAVAIGNHDWLISASQMNEILGAIRPRTPFVAANFAFSSRLKNLARHVVPHVELRKAGLRIAVLGLTTNEFVYRWRVHQGDITDPIARANELLPELRARNDMVIALTHLGTEVDLELARNTSGIGLVVGGHSHTLLHSPLLAKNTRGIPVPVVQAGQHGEYVGDLLVDMEPGKPVQVLRYALVPVHREEPPELASAGRAPASVHATEDMARQVREARAALERRYTPDWLYEPVAFSEVPVERPLYGPTVWGNLTAEAMQEAGSADLSLDVGEFYGEDQPAGPVTRESLMWLYPRSFDTRDSRGWTVWNVKVPGWLLAIVLSEAMKVGRFLNTSGVTYEVHSDEQGTRVENIRIGGRRLRYHREYTVAVSEGIGRGALEISFLLRAIFDPEDTGVPVWTAIERKARQLGGVIRDDSRGLK